MRPSFCGKIPMTALVSVIVLAACTSHAPAIPAAQEASPRVTAAPVALPANAPRADDFTAKVLPVLGKCQPCHFKGGKMYAQLPFDDPQTIRHLGEKIFTRIKDQKEQAVLRAFWASKADSTK